MTTWTITRTGEASYAAVSNIAMSDGSYQCDGHMALTGNVLRSVEQRGYIRIGGLVRLTLGPASLAKVTALGINDSVTLG